MPTTSKASTFVLVKQVNLRLRHARRLPVVCTRQTRRARVYAAPREALRFACVTSTKVLALLVHKFVRVYAAPREALLRRVGLLALLAKKSACFTSAKVRVCMPPRVKRCCALSVSICTIVLTQLLRACYCAVKGRLSRRCCAATS
jgi:hypothetical protein